MSINTKINLQIKTANKLRPSSDGTQ